MKAQVADALENLARVLRASEDDWEVVSQGEEPRSSNQKKEDPKQLPVTPKVTGSTVAYHRDVRCYLVFSNPHDPKSVGFWKGENPSTWKRIEATLKNQSLAGSGARLRRVDSKQQAEELWKKSFPSRPMPVVLEA